MTEEIACPRCYGRGRRLVDALPTVSICTECPDCKGTGRVARELAVALVPAPEPPKRSRREILLSQCMKPEEIDGPRETRERRVRELVAWFARFAEGRANPKWAREHAFELALFAHDIMEALDAVTERRSR